MKLHGEIPGKLFIKNSDIPINLFYRIFEALALYGEQKHGHHTPLSQKSQ